MKLKNQADLPQTSLQPLATRMRPDNLDEVVGQAHLISPGKPLRRAILDGIPHSMIFWGPPGTGKTTLAKLIARYQNAEFIMLSAIFSGVKEIREIIEAAKERRKSLGQPTVLFIDEIHRFNKAQQDVFLPFVEDGTIILIGATTENPSFELNKALLSRARVYVLRSLAETDLLKLITHTLQDKEKGLGRFQWHFSEDCQKKLVAIADGDARQLLNLLEMLADLACDQNQTVMVTEALLVEVSQTSVRRFDKQGDDFYDQISALHKSIRGSSPDAALYWFCRLLDGGADPLYVGRRLIRMATEDIGLADPRALELALNAMAVYERLGSPEGELALAQAVIYLACCAKSNAAYVAYGKACTDAKEKGSLEVPLSLRNAPTRLMKQMGHGKGYRYAHDEQGAYAAGVNYFPEALGQPCYYQPTERGLEAKIREKLHYFKSLDAQVKNT